MRKKSKQSFKRLNLTFSGSSLETLERVRTRLDAASDSEVVRRAVRLYDILLVHSESSVVILRDKDGKEKQLLTL